ncbi:Protein kinase domain family protein [Babesia bovis T2Bo]|uniref:Protein kinase domain-containing protein n=1 Tax=Babesia bovis TaxID=5865 RepID=A7ASN8_BABBO|nr:Protein kinase domain family protein [Babesia bovis T2Bo]EDO07557.1 Protein kinase domain family protein [Babesia bovis T2Bo]|eukprot:XP_001611125.1 hypothetical protein [Babesia bovis T2Bo]
MVEPHALSTTIKEFRSRRLSSKECTSHIIDFSDSLHIARDASSCAVRSNTLDLPHFQPSFSTEMPRVSIENRRRGSLFEFITAADGPRDDSAPSNKGQNDTHGIAKSGSWPEVNIDELESAFECTLNVRNIRKALEPKDGRNMNIQKSSRCVEAALRTFSKRSGRVSPRRPACVSTGLQATKDKRGAQWMHLIKGLRVKRWSQILTETIRKPSTNKLNDKIKEKPIKKSKEQIVTNVNGGVEPWINKGIDKIFEAALRTRGPIKQYARFIPQSSIHVVNNEAEAKHAITITPHCSDTNIIECIPPLEPINYGLIRMKGSVGRMQIYDCLDNDKGRVLSLNLLPKDHPAIEIYELLCQNAHPNIVKVEKVLEDENAFYVLLDCDNDMYLGEFYQKWHKNAFTSIFIRNVVRQILSALAYIHKRGMAVSRLSMDSITIKESVDGYLGVKLVRIESVCPKGSISSVLPQNDVFTAPEVQCGEITPSSDMWSIGVIMNVLVEGKLPIINKKHSMKHQKGVDKDQIPCFTSDMWVQEPEMRDFCLSCLEVNQTKRITSAMEALIHPWVKQ